MQGPDTRPDSSLISRAGADASVVLGYAILTILLTWPMAARLDQYVISEYMETGIVVDSPVAVGSVRSKVLFEGAASTSRSRLLLRKNNWSNSQS